MRLLPGDRGAWPFSRILTGPFEGILDQRGVAVLGAVTTLEMFIFHATTSGLPAYSSA